MNRLTSRIALACALFVSLAVGFAATARAEWVQQDIGWLRQRSYNVGTKQDSLWTTFAASKVDTSTGFNMDDVDFINLGEYGRSSGDSTQLGKLVIYADSSVASSVNFKATSCKFQINYSANSANWQDLATVNCVNTDGKKSWLVPIYLDPAAPGSATDDANVDFVSPIAIFGAQLRVIVTGGASVAVPAARLKLVKYKQQTKGN